MAATDTVNLGEIKKSAPTDAWTGEVAFSAWLAANLGQLSDVLGLGDLELIGTEQPVGEFRCDILAREIGTERKLVIENQFDKTNHDHLGKLLTYAASNDASIVIWISTHVRDEHRATIDWLNRRTPKEIGFFAVLLRIIQIDDSRPAPLFEVRASPNGWGKPSLRADVSPRNEKYRQFFQLLIDELRIKHQFTNAKLGRPQSWYNFASGTTGFVYSANFTSGGFMKAELYISTGDKQANKAAFDYLWQQHDQICNELPGVQWERLDNRDACRIFIASPSANIDDAATRGAEMRQWLIEKLLALKKVFGPRLKGAAEAAEAAISRPAQPPELVE